MRLFITIIIFATFALILFLRVALGGWSEPERKLDEAIGEIHNVMSNADTSENKERRIKSIAEKLFDKSLVEKYSKNIRDLDSNIAIEVVSRSLWKGCVCFYREIRIWESRQKSRLFGIIFYFRREGNDWKVYKIS